MIDVCECVQGKWAKTRQGKVLVCQPSGTAKPYLQFQTSGQVVATAHVQTPLKQVCPLVLPLRRRQQPL